jgi:polyisoprenoid-binding protein YceI
MQRLVLTTAAVLFAASSMFAQTPAASPSGAATSNVWQVDSSHSSAQFSVKHLLVSTVRGTLGKVSGTIHYDGKSVESIRADIAIDVNGINTGQENRDRDLRSESFFDVAKYPTVTFRSKRVEAAGEGGFRLVGDLSMHGVTKEIALDVDGPSPVLKGPNGSMKVGASAETKLNRRDYGLLYSKMVEAAPVVSDEVQIQIDIEANKQ